MKTVLIILAIIAAILLLAWYIHRTVRISLCCGTCGCNLLTDEQKKKMLAKREKKALRKSKCGQSCCSSKK